MYILINIFVSCEYVNIRIFTILVNFVFELLILTLEIDNHKMNTIDKVKSNWSTAVVYTALDRDPRT